MDRSKKGEGKSKLQKDLYSMVALVSKFKNTKRYYTLSMDMNGHEIKKKSKNTDMEKVIVGREERE